MAQAQFAAFGDAFDPADFGLEIEAPISVDEQSTVDNVRIGAAAKRIGPLFEGAGVEFTTEPFLEAAHPKENPDYTKWHIVADSSTYSPRHIEGVSPLEFKSPVWKANGPEWRQQLSKLESLICPQLPINKPESFQSCSTQIHLSFPSEQRNTGGLEDFPVAKARLIMFAAFVFEDVLDDLLPMKKEPERYTRRNTMLRNIETPDDGDATDLKEIWNIMREIPTIQKLNKMVCFEKQYGLRAAGAPLRTFKWNTSGGALKSLMWKTVEYRQLPPMTSEGELVIWINFILGFVGAATSIDLQKLDEAAKISEEAVYGVYGLERKPTGFADIQRFIEQFIKRHPGCKIDKEELKRTPDIKAPVQEVLKK